MTDVYKFSQSSLELLDRCIATAASPGTKWIKLFKRDTKELPVEDAISYVDILSASESSDVAIPEPVEQETTQYNLEQIEKIRAILEATPSNKLEYLIEQENYEYLLPVLAKNLTSESIEQICDDLLKNFNVRYEEILIQFFPVYVKQETTWAALNLFDRCYKIHRDTVIRLMVSLFVNIEVPSKLIEEFFKVMDDEARSQFLQALTIKQLPPEVFIHHLNTINCIYKSCQNTSDIHNFVLNGLLESAELCQDSKIYGQCLLTFFQSLNEMDTQISQQVLEQLLESHNTPFKRLCSSILGNLYKKQD